MTSPHSSQASSGSVVRRFNIALGLLYLAGILVSAPAIYFYTQHQVYAQATTKLGMLVDMVDSIKGYVAKDLRPYFLEKGLFHTAGFSGIVATARIAMNFAEKQPTYTIRSIGDNPLNPSNLPELAEQTLLERFREDPSLNGVTEEATLGGHRMLLAVAPMKSKKGCLKCHGDPAQVPEEIVKEYGLEAGYNYKLGDTVGLSVIGVPLADVNDVALQRSLMAIGFMTLMFGVVFITINVLVRRYLISPILAITEVAHAVAKGDLEQSLNMPRNDEIGDLARSVELLRRSFAQVMSRMRKGGR